MKKKYIQSLLKKGYFIFEIKKNEYVKLKSQIEKQLLKNNRKIKLDNLHKLVSIKSLNRVRMNLFKNLNKDSNFKKKIFESAQQFIEGCVGSEICSSDINLSIQMPNDETSLLEMHTDFFSGESLFQINLWIPFVDVRKTQSMFIIDPLNSYKILKKIKNDKKINFKDINKNYSKNLKWLKLKSGQGLLFSPNCLHGNVVNKENKTRVSINIRYKNIFSPYSDFANEKKVGSFYKVLSPKAVTLFNLKHNFDEII